MTAFEYTITGFHAFMHVRQAWRRDAKSESKVFPHFGDKGRMHAAGSPHGHGHQARQHRLRKEEGETKRKRQIRSRHFMANLW